MTAQSNRVDGQRVVDGKELHAAAVNEHQARAAAGITMAFGTVAFVYANFDKVFWPIRSVSAFFFVDFLFRVTAGLERSPSGLVARWMTRRQAPQWVSAKPKRFAWTLGLAMALAMTVITNSGIHGPLPRTICLICLTLMWMEAVLGLCLGCEMYAVMVRRRWRAPDAAFEICANGACEVLPHREKTIVSSAPSALVAPSPQPVSRDAFVGIDQLIPLFGGTTTPFVNLDNAASTPAFRSVIETIDEFLPFYAGVHRGTGYKSRLSTVTFERARELLGEFFGADPERDVVVFTKNTTEAINKVARSLPIDADSVVLTTLLEHHSNDLPWRGNVRTVHVGARPDGSLDLDDLQRLLDEHAGRIALLAVSGASNVTGVVQPVHLLAEMVHSVGGRILVDAAQLAPHRPIDMGPHDAAGHLDFVACSAHKMYAPFGTGALVGPRCAFGPAPDQTGGGTVHAVTTDAIVWGNLPDREEAGSPNVIGAIALAAATRTLSEIGLDRIAAHEIELTRYATRQLSKLPGLRVYGPAEVAGPTAKLGVIPFTIAGIDHGLIAAVLGYEHGVGVRSGCFCAHPYIGHLLRRDRTESRAWVDRARDGDKRGAPGMVRISFGCYNNRRDVDVAVAALEQLIAGNVSAAYRSDRDGSFHPVGYVEPTMFSLDAR